MSDDDGLRRGATGSPAPHRHSDTGAHASERASAAVIGAGFGGLAVGIRLQAAGVQTTIFEKRDKPGGRAYVYEDQGFTFDGGPTVITDPPCLAELWSAAGRSLADDVTLLPVHPFYRLCWDDGFVFDYSNDQEALDRQIAAISPVDLVGYRRFLRFSQHVLQKGYVEMGAVPFLDLRSMARVTPTLLRIQGYRSVYAIVARFIRHEHLRQAFSFHTLLVGGNPFSTPAIYTLIHALERAGGVWFPKGGTGALINAMAALFVRLGGRLALDAPVEAIATRDGKAVGVVSRGQTHEARFVVSNADVMHTYGTLLGHHAHGRRRASRLARKRYSMSLFVVYFGLRGDHRGLAHHTVCFGPRYRPLISEIFAKNALAEDFSLYLHAPNATDPSLAPPGHSAYYVLSPVPHLGTAASIDWDHEASRYRDRIFAALERRFIPNLSRDLVVSRMLTPLDFRDELNSHLGSAFSLEPRLTQSAWFRPHNRDRDLPGLYFVGAGTHPGAGVPGVVSSAKATAGLILESLAEAGSPRL